MAILCKERFELVLITDPYGERLKESVVYCTADVEELLDWPDDYCIEVKENTNYDLYFNSHSEEARLYIEGLEYTQSDKVYFDSIQKKYYCLADPHPFIWFKWDQTEQSLIPGTYYITIQIGIEKYYTLLKVYPLRIERHQLEMMKEEIKRFLGGLEGVALRDTISNRMYSGRQGEDVNKLEILAKWEEKLVHVLLEMRRNPHEQIEKTYAYTPRERCKKIDAYAIQRTLGQRYEVDKGYSYTKTITYDTPENRWFKAFNEKVIRFISGQNLTQVSAPIREACLRIQYTCQSMRQLEWYNEMPYCIQEKFPMRSRYESRFRILHEFEQTLWCAKSIWTIERIEEHLYQQTSWLYEVWGIVKLIDMLTTQMGYVCHRQNTQQMDFWLYKDNCKLHVVYDKMIPVHIDETNAHDNPLYAISPIHRKPDGRVDIYKADSYTGSLIIEFKYSHINNIWQESRKTRCSEQLLHYGYQLQSIYQANPYKLPNHLLRQLNPIRGVLVCLPTLRKEMNQLDDLETNVTLVALKPELQHDAMVMYLKQMIEEMEEACIRDCLKL